MCTSPLRWSQARGGLLLALLAAAVLPGCSRGTESGRSPRTPERSPRDTIAQLIKLRETGAYDGMKPLIVPEYAADVTITLVAVQEFLNANDQLCDLVRRDVGIGLSQSIDQSFRAYYLDIFSKYVELMDEKIEGADAMVSFIVDGKLPARQARLRLVDGTWRYDPGPGDYERLAEAFQRMARGLRQATEEIQSGRLSPQALRDEPERLAEEVRVRLLPGVKMLPKPPVSQPDNGGG